MGKRKIKVKEVVCFCGSKPDIDDLLRREIVQGDYLSRLFGTLPEEQVYELEAMLAPHLRVDGSSLSWWADAPSIEIVVESDKAAKVRSDIARKDLAAIVESQPHAWFSQDQMPVNELKQKLAACRSLVTFRWPDVDTEPVSEAGFWICNALAKALANRTSGVVMLRDRAFVARGGRVIE